ncbi:MAG: hypothetical protein WCQ99_13725, partial [Pseudomonadota bacterium]
KAFERIEPVRVKDDKFYRLPYYAELVMTKGHLLELKSIISEIQIYNNEYAGHAINEVEVMLNGDSSVIELKKRLLELLRSYCNHRLTKKGVRAKK